MKWTEVIVSVDNLGAGQHIEVDVGLNTPSGHTSIFVVPIIWENPAWLMVNIGFTNERGYFLGVYNTFTSPLSSNITCRNIYI